MSHITAKFNTARESHGRQRLTGAKAAKPTPTPRVPHVAKLMALAIRLDDLLESGQVHDQAELARLGRVSRARLTQILNLLHLAPDIQEQVLSLHETDGGRDAVFERDLRPIAKVVNWGRQRKMWRASRKTAGASRSALTFWDDDAPSNRRGETRESRGPHRSPRLRMPDDG